MTEQIENNKDTSFADSQQGVSTEENLLNSKRESESIAQVSEPKKQLKASEEIESKLNSDLAMIQKLSSLNLITSSQGQNLMNHVIKKAYDMVLQNDVSAKNVSQSDLKLDKSKAFSEFYKVCPEFFSPDGRKEVLDYLNTDGISLDKDELLKISKLVEKLEETAIQRYLQKDAHEKNILKQNELAKQKLQSVAQKSNGDAKNTGIFTREQIGKMSKEEFLKNESLIMEQLRAGKIK